MGRDEGNTGGAEPEPSFDDPLDPRWSQDPVPLPPRNPYLDMPLDAPPLAGERFQGQGSRPGQNAAQQGRPQPGYPQPYPPQGYQVQAQPPSGALAIVSLVAGIIGILSGGMFLIPEIAAIVCGHLALRREPQMRGIAIAGLVMGYLGLAFIVLVAAFFIIVFSSPFLY